MKLNQKYQYGISVLIVVCITCICYFLFPLLNYKAVAFILLFCVSILAMIFDILPVLLAATLSALAWDFFFIEPKFTFSIGNTDDRFLLMMYFIIASVNSVLSYKIRRYEKQIRTKQNEEKVIQLYNTLFNSLSHELKTPIATIIGATDTLRDKNLQISDENKELLIDEIAIASFRLNDQVINLLNMSRLETGTLRLKLAWCEIEEIIYSVINKLDTTKFTQQLLVDVPSNLPFYQLDKGIIEQVLHNLIINAIMYTPDYTKISISVLHERLILNTTDEIQTDKLILLVSDNGKGFPADKIEHVFDKFYRIHDQVSGGTGLGLSIVKGFVEAHQGKISLENSNLGGALFTIEIPCETSYANQIKHE